MTVSQTAWWPPPRRPRLTPEQRERYAETIAQLRAGGWSEAKITEAIRRKILRDHRASLRGQSDSTA